jgi:hypothetical protein
MSTIKILAVTIVVSVATLPALAQEMRCGNLLISGDQMHPLLKEQVLKECGEPTSRESNRWYYEKQGKILVFNDNGELDHIVDAAHSK